MVIHTPKEFSFSENMRYLSRSPNECLFEIVLAWGILGQQINLTYAYTFKRRLVEMFGIHIEYDGKKYWLFPTPEVIADLTVEDLADMKMTVKNSEYLIGVAGLLVRGDLQKKHC